MISQCANYYPLYTPESSRIIGLSRSELDNDGFRAQAEEALRRFIPETELDEDILPQFLQMLQYRCNDVTFGTIARGLEKNGLAHCNGRLVVEKPLGHDLASARQLNQDIAAVFDESCVYRIDHYLGKETVQNLMAMRFANALFEPIWNAAHIDHVQIMPDCHGAAVPL